MRCVDLVHWDRKQRSFLLSDMNPELPPLARSYGRGVGGEGSTSNWTSRTSGHLNQWLAISTPITPSQTRLIIPLTGDQNGSQSIMWAAKKDRAARLWLAWSELPGRIRNRCFTYRIESRRFPSEIGNAFLACQSSVEQQLDKHKVNGSKLNGHSEVTLQRNGTHSNGMSDPLKTEIHPTIVLPQGRRTQPRKANSGRSL